MEVVNSVCNDNYVFIDLQGFRNGHRFICKEFSLIDGHFRFHAIVKSPYSFTNLNDYFQRHALWAIRHFHGIKYESGKVNINEVTTTIYSKIMKKRIIVRHPWKIAWLKYVFRNCGELDCVCIDDLGFDITDRNEEIYEICDYHNEIYGWKECRCALAITLEMKTIAEKNNFIETELIESDFFDELV